MVRFAKCFLFIFIILFVYKHPPNKHSWYNILHGFNIFHFSYRGYLQITHLAFKCGNVMRQNTHYIAKIALELCFVVPFARMLDRAISAFILDSGEFISHSNEWIWKIACTTCFENRKLWLLKLWHKLNWLELTVWYC